MDDLTKQLADALRDCELVLKEADDVFADATEEDAFVVELRRMSASAQQKAHAALAEYDRQGEEQQ